MIHFHTRFSSQEGRGGRSLTSGVTDGWQGGLLNVKNRATTSLHFSILLVFSRFFCVFGVFSGDVGF